MGVFLLAGLVSILSAHSIQGVILDEITQRPLQNYPLVVNKKHCETDSLGYFFVDVNETIDTVSLSAPNYYSKTISVQSIKQFIFLTPFSYPEKSILVTGEYKGFYNHLDVITPPTTLSPISIQSSNSTQQIFNRLPGVIVKSYGGSAGVSTLSFHGGQGNRIAVLLNGFKLNNDQNGSTDISQIPSVLMENIEFIPQGSSSIYGSSANTGVINILPNHSPFSFSLSLRKNHVNISHFMQLKNQNVIGGFGIGKQRTHDSYSYTETGNYNNVDQTWGNYDWLKSNLNQHFIYGWVDYKIKQNFIVSSQLLHSENERITSGFIYNNPAFYPELNDNISIFSTSITASKIKYNFGLKKIEMDYNSNSPNHLNVGSHHTLENVNHQIIFDCSEFKLQSDIDISKSKSTDAKNASRVGNTTSLHYVNSWGWGTVGVSILQDIQKSKTPVSSYELYYSFPEFSHVSSSFTYSKNYKKPNLNDLFWNTLGNPNLEPEFSFNYYWKNKWSSNKISLQADFYFIEYDNLIKWTPQINASGLWKPSNISKAQIAGYHVVLDISESFYFSFDNSFSTDLSDVLERSLLYTPEKIITTNYTKDFNNFTLSIHGKYTSSRLRQYGAIPLPSYTTIDVSFIKMIHFKNSTLETKFEINNINNTQFQSVFGYPNPGRQVLLTFKIKGVGK